MCINEQTLSAYIDGELGEFESSNIEEHLGLCSICRNKVDSFKKVVNQLNIPGFDVNRFVQDNVWARLVHSTSTSSKLDFWHRGFSLAPSLMVSLSFVFLAVIGIGLFLVIPDKNNMHYLANNSESTFYSEDIPVEIPIDNIEKVLAYFDIHDEASEVFIELPETSVFSFQGEPLFLRKSDYTARR